MIYRFLGKLLLLSLLIITSIIGIGILPREAILNIFVDKQEKLRTVDAPRIIFIGGSGMIFGLDSPCIEAAFGIPVVNAGLHAGLGLRFLLDHVRPYIKKGDIIVVIPEYGVLSRGYSFNPSTTAGLVFTDIQDKAKYFSIQDYADALRGFPSLAYEKVVVRPLTRLESSATPFGYPKSFYWRDLFNSNGDYIGHLNDTKTLPPKELETYPVLITGNIAQSIVMLNEFAEYTNNRGARMIIGFPPVVDSRYQKYEPIIVAIYRRLQRQVQAPILSPPSNYLYPINYFYDTPEHLTARGRKARTERLIADLKQIQPDIAQVATTTTICADGSKP
jgi:hypothetical protein